MPETRRHAAIMFTDIVGYTRLMGSDEEKAVDMLSRNRSIHQSCIEKFNGTLIKEIGDGILASFSLASEAVRCAIDIQKECKEQDIPLKIGIHEGEMIFSGSDVIGDGVNIASRLQEDAQEGCILISGSVYYDIKNKAGIRAEFIGEKTFKNVDVNIKTYRVIFDQLPSNTEKELPSKPNDANTKSIIVLPFVNMSPDPDQEFFSDGLTEEIITDLSHINDLLVISRSSAMTFKGTGKTIREIASKVNVRYALEGSVRKAGNDLRITAQLIDASTDAHLWAEKYNGTLDDVFDIQEKVSLSIADALKIKLSQSSYTQITNISFNDPSVYELYLKARYENWKFNVSSFQEAEKLLRKGLKIGGDNVLLYTELCLVNVQYVNNLLLDPFTYPEILSKANHYAQKAMQINPHSASALYARGIASFQSGYPVEAFKSWDQAIKIEPNFHDPMLFLFQGFMYAVTGIDFKESERLLDICKNKDPLTPIVKTCQGWRLPYQGEFQKALDEFIEWQKQLESVNSPFLVAFVWWHGLNRNFKESYRIIDLLVDENPTGIASTLGQFMRNAWKGNKRKALELVSDELEKAVWWDDGYAMIMAEAYSMLAELDKAFIFLNRAIEYGNINIPFLNEYDHFLENLRSDKRFEDCLTKARGIAESIKKIRRP